MYFREDKLRMSDFLYVENEKIVRNSIKNYARFAQEKCWYFFFIDKI